MSKHETRRSVRRLYQLRLRPKEEGRLPVLTSIPARCLVSPVCKEQVNAWNASVSASLAEQMSQSQNC